MVPDSEGYGHDCALNDVRTLLWDALKGNLGFEVTLYDSKGWPHRYQGRLIMIKLIVNLN
eukprot:1368127-Amorphochlora_amoeboformis.AAC.2